MNISFRTNEKTPLSSGNNTRAQLQYSRLVGESESSVDSESNWLITLSDIFTLLLVFLIMFFVMTRNTDSSVNPLPAKNQTVSLPIDTPDNNLAFAGTGIKDEIVRKMNGLDLGNDVSVSAANRTITVTVKEKVTFRPAEADLLAGFGPVLDNIADIIRKYPRFLVEIEGHTDNVPIMTSLYPSNWELSVARATSVLKYFINYHSIDPSRLSVKGSADQRPLVRNDSPENRARNRRVEIRLREREA